jgi:hypothetical protein
MTTDAAPQPAAPPGSRWSLILLAVYAVVVVWAFYEQATSWPHVGSWAFVAYVFLCPGILFQAVSLVYLRWKGRPITRRWLVRLGTIPAGLVIAALLGQSAEALSQSAFEQAYAPFVSRVGASFPDPCAATGYFQIPAVVAFNESADRLQPRARLRHDGKRFVLAFSGGSIDMDGSVVYYDSGAAGWRKFHNNDAAGQKVFDDLTAGLQECVISARPASG